MVWKKIKNQTKEQAEYLSKNAIKVATNPLFFNAHTREARELNQAENCKITTEKTLTNSQSKIYNQILDEQRKKEDPLRAKSHKVKSK